MNLNDYIENELTVQRPIFAVNFVRLKQYMFNKVFQCTFLHSAETFRKQETASHDFLQKYNISKNDFFSKEVTRFDSQRPNKP